MLTRCFLSAVAAMMALAAPAAAQTEHLLKAVLENGRSTPSAVSLVHFTDKAGAPVTVLVGQPIGDETRITTPAGIAVVIVRTDRKATITVNPGSSLTLVATTDKGEATVVNSGGAGFDAVPNFFDFFRVGFRRFTASVRGTAFTVQASATSVSFRCSRGAVDVLRPGAVYLTKEYRTINGIVSVERISPGAQTSVKYALDERSYVQRFGTLKDAEAYFRKQLAAAQKSGDNVQIDAALDSLFRLYATLNKTGDSLTTARARLAFVQAHRANLNERSLADAYRDLGWCFSDASGVRYSEQSIAIWSRLDPGQDEGGFAEAQDTYADNLMDVGRAQDAFTAFDLAKTIAHRAGDPINEAWAIEDTGVLDGRLHDYTDEIQHYKDALALMQQAFPSGTWPDNLYFFRNLSLSYGDVNDTPEKARYAALALQQWQKLIGDATNTRISQAVHDDFSALQEWGKLNDALALVTRQIEALTRTNTIQSAWGATLLDDRATAYDNLLRRKDATADRARAAAIRKQLPKATPKDPDAVLAQKESDASTAGRKQAAVGFAQQIVARKMQNGQSPLAVADAEIDLAGKWQAAGSTVQAIAAWRRAVVQIARLGPIGRHRLADTYTSIVGLDTAIHDFTAANRDAQTALGIAVAAPTLPRQTANAYRALAWAQDDNNLFTERSASFEQAALYDRQAVPFDAVQFAYDEDNLAWSIGSTGSASDRLKAALAARDAIVKANVPAQSAVWADNDIRVSEGYEGTATTPNFDKSVMQQALDYAIRAYNSLASRRPLMNDETLALFSNAATRALSELARNDNAHRTELLNQAQTYELKTIKVLSNPDTQVTLPLRLVYAYADHEETDMMLASNDFATSVGNALDELAKQEKKGLNRPNITVHDVLEEYLLLAEDAEIFYHDYDAVHPASDAENANFVLQRGLSALGAPHKTDNIDVQYHYWLWVVDGQLGKVADAAVQLKAAHALLPGLTVEQRSVLRGAVRGSSTHSGFGTWDDFTLYQAFAVVTADLDTTLAAFPDAKPEIKDNLIEDYGRLSDADIYVKLPKDAVRDANLGLALDPTNLTLLLNLAHGYLYSGDAAQAKAIYLAHRSDAYKGSTFDKAILTDFANYTRSGVTTPDVAAIAAALQTPP